MTSPYWPSTSEIRNCIRTEAEELANATVLAVHEPMTFRKIGAREEVGEVVGEMDLFQHVIQTNRPTPIIGESGFGKSHVIRWLDLQLARQQRQDWHVVRIGKNASLRHGLMTLLGGLKGPLFDDARRKIDSVGAGLKTQDVAEHLVVFVGARLSQLYEEAERQADQGGLPVQQGSTEVDACETRLRAVRRHAKRNGLASLIGDPNFKGQMIGEGRCFYQIAKRLTEGSSDEEIAAQSTTVKPEDLEIRANLGDFSLDARNYVRNARLNTSAEMREEAANLLNECLSHASRAAFQQLFQFHGGSFQDLFTSIREHLLTDGKTLFVLVEDMAAISAIEDVLIDSLMQEDVRDGKQLLCPLHSAIAVTTGYQGYARRKATISTRAGYEWQIERAGATEKDTLNRIADFCGRYLNAARHGEGYLSATFGDRGASAGWPGVWRSPDPHYRATADVFGESPSGFPLFPYSLVALEAMARRYCKSGDTLEFNPRKILKHALREPLQHFRSLYERGAFPPEGFAGIPCPGSLHGELQRGLREDLGRAETLAAIWGFGAETVAELAFELPAQIADEFGLPGLARLLDRSERKKPKPRSDSRVAPKPKDAADGGGGTVPPVSPVVPEDALAIARQIDEYFSTKSIPQSVANAIRKALADAFDERKQNLSDWYGVKGWPAIKHRQLTLIHVPFNANNPPGTKLKFGSEREFSDRSRALKYKQFMVAILRRESAREGDQQTWAYAKGREDYRSYANFIDDWLPVASETLAQESRAEAAKIIEEQLAAATVFDPLLAKRTHGERLDRLVTTGDAIRQQINCKTGLQAWDQFLGEQVSQWDEKQESWLNAFSTNRHGVEGDLVLKILRRAPECVVPARAQRIAQTAAQEFVKQYSGLELLDRCGTREEFVELITRLRDLVSRLSSTSQFQNMDGVVTARTYRNKIARILEDDKWEPIKHAIGLRQPFEAAAAVKALHGVEPESTQRLNEVMELWREFFTRNRQRLLNENEEQGAPRRKRAEAALGALVERFSKVIGNTADASP